MIAAAAVVVAFLVLCSLARELCRDFYRPWLTRRWQAEHAERRELEAWLASVRAVGEPMQRFSTALRAVGVASQTATTAMRSFSAALAQIGEPK